jgi:hypothetical protein
LRRASGVASMRLVEVARETETPESGGSDWAGSEGLESSEARRKVATVGSERPEGAEGNMVGGGLGWEEGRNLALLTLCRKTTKPDKFFLFFLGGARLSGGGA